MAADQRAFMVALPPGGPGRNRYTGSLSPCEPTLIFFFFLGLIFRDWPQLFDAIRQITPNSSSPESGLRSCAMM